MDNRDALAVGDAAPTPLSKPRVAAALDRAGARYRLDDDGDPLGWWDSNLICFITMGERQEVLTVRATWEPEPPQSMRAHLLEAINTWHRERLWPKVYLVDVEDRLLVVCETCTDLEFGVTDQQLDQLIACGIGTPEQFFDSLESEFPAHGSWIPAPQND